jgi:hypothetical protein
MDQALKPRSRMRIPPSSRKPLLTQVEVPGLVPDLHPAAPAHLNLVPEVMREAMEAAVEGTAAEANHKANLE